MRREELYLTDIVEAADTIQRFIEGVQRENFVDDELRRSAVLQKLIVIGEAAARLPREFTERHPEVEWADIVSFRNIAVHEYFSVNWSIVWVAATQDTPELRRKVEDSSRGICRWVTVPDSSARFVFRPFADSQFRDLLHYDGLSHLLARGWAPYPGLGQTDFAKPVEAHIVLSQIQQRPQPLPQSLKVLGAQLALEDAVLHPLAIVLQAGDDLAPQATQGIHVLRPIEIQIFGVAVAPVH